MNLEPVRPTISPTETTKSPELHCLDYIESLKGRIENLLSINANYKKPQNEQKTKNHFQKPFKG